MSQLKKASNPDLADERQYEEREEFTSPILKPRRGAVQKKVREREERKKLDERIIEKRLWENTKTSKQLLYSEHFS